MVQTVGLNGRLARRPYGLTARFIKKFTQWKRLGSWVGSGPTPTNNSSFIIAFRRNATAMLNAGSTLHAPQGALHVSPKGGTLHIAARQYFILFLCGFCFLGFRFAFRFGFVSFLFAFNRGYGNNLFAVGGFHNINTP